MQQSRRDEFSHLYAECVDSYLATPSGENHLASYAPQREEARRSLEDILAKRDRGEDVTDDVLLKLLPYVDTSSNRAAGAWVHIAPAITGNLKLWYERAHRTAPEDWPHVAEAILAFVLRCRDRPDALAVACEEFAALPYSVGFQTGMLSPILNAVHPDEFRIVNNKVRTVINYLTGARHGQPLVEYPATNETASRLLDALADVMRGHPLPEGARLADVFDAFCHWLVSVRKYGFEKRFARLTEGQVGALLEEVHTAFPAWTGFGDPRFGYHELSYKRAAVGKARELLSEGELRRLLAEGEHDEILSRLEAVGKATNLLYLARPRTGDLGILYREELDKPAFCRAIIDLLYGEGPTEERLEAYARYVEAQALPNKWTFPTYLLFLCHPDTEMFVKPYTVRWLFRRLQLMEYWDWKPNRTMYAVVKEVATDILTALEPYGASDMVDAQSVIWTGYGYEEGEVEDGWGGDDPAPYGGPDTSLAEPFPRIFADREEAEWAFGLLRDAVQCLGVTGPDDERFAVTLRGAPRGGKRLRLIYGNWPVLGFQGPETAAERVEMALLEARVAHLEKYRSYAFSQGAGEPKVNVYSLPMDLARDMEDELRPLLRETLSVVADLFGHWSRSGVRKLNQPDIVRGILDPAVLPERLSRGVEESSRSDGYFTEETFALLAELSETPTRAFYQEHREAFSDLLEEPFAALLADVARRLPAEVTAPLETERNVTAHIPKNDFGRGGAWDHYWGAFYPKGGRRISEAQLFVWMNRDEVGVGFYIGEYGEEPRGRFRRNVHAHRERLTAILGGTLGDVPDLVFGARDEPEASLAAWLLGSSPTPRANVVLSPEEVLALSRQELAERVADAFVALFPLVLLAASEDPMPAIELYTGEAPPPELQPEYSLADCTADTGFRVSDLRDWLAGLERKGQAILYGPPGTGKTYLAERLARHLVGGTDGFWEVVQFHPAYAYEDFVQGIRPEPGADGRLTYPVQRGRFLRFCDEAARREGPCVLIIDEINRAELARVFGELMYLLEYRGQQVRLAVDGRSFTIPANVRLIGTMNTADRSIALVDHALRRRFAFIALYPQYDVLRRFHARHTEVDVEGLIGVLRDLNREIGDPNYAVGITFFLHPDLGRHLESIWRMEIEPYLEEYFFDKPSRVDPFRWERVRDRMLPGQP